MTFQYNLFCNKFSEISEKYGAKFDEGKAKVNSEIIARLAKFKELVSGKISQDKPSSWPDEFVAWLEKLIEQLEESQSQPEASIEPFEIQVDDTESSAYMKELTCFIGAEMSILSRDINELRKSFAKEETRLYKLINRRSISRPKRAKAALDTSYVVGACERFGELSALIAYIEHTLALEVLRIDSNGRTRSGPVTKRRRLN